MWLSIGHRLADANRCQLTNKASIVIDWSIDFPIIGFIDCSRPDSPVPLNCIMIQTDLGSLIWIQITPKEHSPRYYYNYNQLSKMPQMFDQVLTFNLHSCHMQMGLFPVVLVGFWHHFQHATGNDSSGNTAPKLGHQNSVEPYSTDNHGRWHKNTKTIELRKVFML